MRVREQLRTSPERPSAPAVHRLEGLRSALVAWRETIIETALGEAGFGEKYVRWEFDQAIEVLNRFIEADAEKQPAPALSRETVAVLLPYHVPIALPVALAASGVMAGRRVALRVSTEFPKTGQLVGGLIEEAIDGVRLVQDPGRQFILRHLRSPETTVLVVFGDDQWVSTYEDLVRRCETKRFIFQGPAKDPVIVLQNAALDKAAQDAVRGALFHGGQACLCPKRFYVVKKVAKEFTRLVVEALQADEHQAQLHDGAVRIMNENVIRRLKTQLEDALGRGGKIRFGGRIMPCADGGGYLVEPTVLTDVNHAMSIMHEETLAPILPIRVVADAAEAAAMAEDSRYGLAASVYGTAPDLLSRLQRSHGTVTANGLALDHYRFDIGIGGFKNSGWVWERSENNFCRREGRRLPYYLEFQGPVCSWD